MKGLSVNLLEYLAHEVGCSCISDLLRLSTEDRIQLAQVVETLPPDGAERREWNAALMYLTGAPLEMTAKAAHRQLIIRLDPSLKRRGNR